MHLFHVNSQLLQSLAIAAALTSFASAQPAAGISNNGRGAFATHRYRNLFLEDGHSKVKIAAKVDAAFQQLFHGDPSTQTVYYPAGNNANGPLAYLTDVHNRDVRTEGMSYGMMIAVQMDKQPEFDALWNWAKTYMYIADPNHPSFGYFSWSCKTDGSSNEETAAPDGEEYFVMSLYFASNRWGDRGGIYNYKANADAILTTMRHRVPMSGQTRFGPRTVASMVNEDKKMIRFVPGVDRGNFTDPSYHLPAFYELWARWGPVADRTFWGEAAAASRDFFQQATNRKTGLAPDYANFDGTPHPEQWNKMAGNFSYDAWRTASNWSVDWSWWAKDPREQPLSDRIQSFFAAKGMASYGEQFTLDGETLNPHHATGLVATNAVASLAATVPGSKEFVEALWNAPVPSGDGRYYDGMLYMLSLLHCSGQFRIWMPR
jgi:oligosaccharide reducing-end xylanase